MVSVVHKMKYDFFDYFELAVKFIKLGDLVKYHIGFDLDILDEQDAFLEVDELEEKIFCTVIQENRFGELRRLVLDNYEDENYVINGQ